MIFGAVVIKGRLYVGRVSYGGGDIWGGCYMGVEVQRIPRRRYYTSGTGVILQQ